MVGRRVVANPLLNPRAERVVKVQTIAETHEQHDALVRTALASERLPDHDALNHLRHVLHLPINLSGANAHATGIQRRIAATVDDETAARRELSPVAVPPHPRPSLEVRRPILASVRIIPECDRHARKRCRTDQLTRLAHQRTSIVAPHLDAHSVAARLKLSAIDGLRGIAKGEAGDDVGAAADAAQSDVRLHALVHIVVAVRREWTPCGQDGA